jgi:transposase
MSSIVRQKVGKHTYLYESISYRNEQGKPRCKRTPVGKLDSVTGQPIYKPTYIKRMAAEGKPIAQSLPPISFTTNEIQHSTIRDYGAFYLYQQMADKIGLLQVLRETLPEHWMEIFNLAAYLISTGDPFNYCEDWLASTEAYSVGAMTSQRISELLANISQSDRNRFYQGWCALRGESEFLALDITSTSSYSSLIDSVEWGYNRDGEALPQVNICLLMGYQSRLPVYQTVFGGSLKDVTTLQTTLQSFRALAGELPIVAVMDKGFYSAKNVNMMLSDAYRTDFLIAVPFTNKFATDIITVEKKGIDTLNNTIAIGSDTLRAVTKLRNWQGKDFVFTHVYYNVRKAMNIRENLYHHVTLLREQALANPVKCKQKPEFTKYLSFRCSEKTQRYTVSIREDVVAAELNHAGWLVIISNCVDDPKAAIRIYREKDVVEKGFLRLKNSLDLARFRVHSETRMQNKVFVGFVSLILLSAIHNVMLDKQLYSQMTLRKLVLTLSKLKIQTINGTVILSPLTKDIRGIYAAFGLPLPV